MIEIQNLYKSFSLSKKQSEATGGKRKVDVVAGLNFSCHPGRIFSLLGPNGAGKTTTLRMIATILMPSSGSVKVAGFDTQKEPNEVRRQIGFLTGTTGLYNRLTPDEFIRYFANLYQINNKEYENRKDSLYTLLDMHDFANKRIGKLSTGMRQKVSIVRTMIHDPSVVVFDEPTSGLDVITAENIIRLIRNCKEQGKTVLFSSHIMSEVDLLCDDLAIIHKGQLIFQDQMEVFRNQMQADSLTQEFIRRIHEAEA